jgi:hypothetical protein
VRRTCLILFRAGLLIAFWELGLRPFVTARIEGQSTPSVEKDNEELTRMFTEDQADRSPEGGKPIDWAVVGPRDKKRLARVRELYRNGDLRTGKDYYHSAMVLQHSDQAPEHLLAHELCVVAVGKGENLGRWLAAASEDRFLTDIGRPQRFGTQYKASGPRSPFRLVNVEEGVTDGLRRAFNAPTLAEAKAREAEMNKD